jgi:hypothetical protein
VLSKATKNIAILAAISMSLASVPGVAAAGNSVHKYDDGTKLRINCTGGGCTVKAKKKGGKWATIEKGPGGRENFLILDSKYKTQKPDF